MAKPVNSKNYQYLENYKDINIYRRMTGGISIPNVNVIFNTIDEAKQRINILKKEANV